MIKFIRSILLFLLTAVIIYTYHPMFFNEYGDPIGTLDRIILILTVILFILILPSIGNLLNNKFIRIYLLLFGIIILEIILFHALGWNIDLTEIRTLIIPFILLTIGYVICNDIRTVNIVCLIYVFVLIYVVFQQISQNIGGFIIEDQYNTSAKNSLGPMLAIAGTISILFALRSRHWTMRTIMLIATFIILLELLTIRARLATLSYIIVLTLTLYKYFKGVHNKKRFILIALGSIFTIGILCSFYIELFAEYIYDSFTQNKEGDILSGRNIGYIQAWNLLSENPWFGNITVAQQIPWVHNYVLLKLSDMGIIGSLPWLILYIYIGCNIIKGYVAYKYLPALKRSGYLLMFIPFIVSMGEPTFPYGPGTANFIAFILLGATLNYIDDTRHNKLNNL